ncbi:MAG: SoxR reducing system RseC family protein [Thermodesulfobacteriota bacterium]
MPVEEGVVLKRIESKGLALVKTVRSSACESCSARHSCSGQDAGSEMEVEAVNVADASVGDRVQIAIESKTLLSAAFLLYVLPIVAMAIGAALGDDWGPKLGYDPTLTSIVLGMGAFVVAFCIVRWHANRKASGNAYRPRIVRVVE